MPDDNGAEVPHEARTIEGSKSGDGAGHPSDVVFAGLTFWLLLAGIVLGTWRLYLSTESFWWSALAAVVLILVAVLLNAVVFLGPSRTGAQAATLLLGLAAVGAVTVYMFPVVGSETPTGRPRPSAQAASTKLEAGPTDTPAPEGDDASEPLTAEEAFLLIVRATTSLSSLTDATLLAFGRAACTDLDNGDFDATLADAGAAGLDGKSAGALIAAAENNLCPEHQGRGPGS